MLAFRLVPPGLCSRSAGTAGDCIAASKATALRQTGQWTARTHVLMLVTESEFQGADPEGYAWVERNKTEEMQRACNTQSSNI
eukprot:347475-Chlamydomonas_euryale.AAC.2